MRRIFAIALAMLWALGASALAEADVYWTGGEDWYYHAVENCGGAEDRAPVSQEDLAGYQKEACPLCMPWSGGGSIYAVWEAGENLLMVRIPDALLVKMAKASAFAPEDATGDRDLAGEEALRRVGDCLNGRALDRFLSELREKGSAGAEALVPVEIDAGFEGGPGQLLSRRHLGGGWNLLYQVEPPEELRGELRAVVRWYRLRMEDGLLRCTVVGRATCDGGEFRPVERRAEVVLEVRRDGLRLRVLRVPGLYIAQVLRGGEGGSGAVELCIESGAPIPLAGFAAGDPASSAFVVTRSEIRALMGGADVALREAEADFIRPDGDALEFPEEE